MAENLSVDMLLKVVVFVDFVRDTSDTEWSSDEQGVEFEPVTEPEDEDDAAAIGDSSCPSDNEIISTKVVEVSVRDDGSLQLADSECSAYSSDSELDLHDYWLCATCRTANNTPFYRYCEKCFRIRKNFFPPRPKPKRKRKSNIETTNPQPVLSQDSGVESLVHSQGLDVAVLQRTDSEESKRIETYCKNSDTDVKSYSDSDSESEAGEKQFSNEISKEVSKKVNASRSRPKRERGQGRKCSSRDAGAQTSRQRSDSDKTNRFPGDNGVESDSNKRRRADDTERQSEILPKRIKTDYDSDSPVEAARCDVAPLVKTVSDPAVTVRASDGAGDGARDGAGDGARDGAGDGARDGAADGAGDKCIVCTTEPKSGVFVHGRIAHICCCYKCAVRVWKKTKRCPVCNSKVSNVLRAIVM
ncbi:unnamed protein product [Euphydryas editha]|uniref:Uncharacterized protein n=1 Tax=Euphydryas editha TaxID=104508 RepID=A0AAU9TH70_EUPED|nr:unnamed protein product [Euphydryas editha]